MKKIVTIALSTVLISSSAYAGRGLVNPLMSDVYHREARLVPNHLKWLKNKKHERHLIQLLSGTERERTVHAVDFIFRGIGVYADLLDIETLVDKCQGIEGDTMKFQKDKMIKYLLQDFVRENLSKYR